MAVELQVYGGYRALVDAEELEKVNTYKWYVVSGSIRTSQGLRLHHLIKGKPPAGLVTDHIDGDFTNNQKANLRFVTQRENMASAYKHSKGYYWDRSRQRWQVSLTVNYRRVNGGRFEREEDAAQRAKELRIYLQGVICK